MAKIEVVMPKMGESIVEATVLQWNKSVGDTIELDEAIMEIATDKVDSEVPSPVEGVLLEMRCNEGDVVPVDTVIAVIETEAAVNGAEVPSANGTQKEEKELPVLEVAQIAVAEESATSVAASKPSGSRFYSPLVLNIARKESVSMTELEQLAGSGREGRVTKKDILAYVKGPRDLALGTATAPAAKVDIKTPSTNKGGASSPASSGIQQKSFSHSGDMDIVEMDRMRKMIAENMVYSKSISAHVTSFVEADVTNLFKWRNKNKAAFEAKYGQKLTFTPIFVEAVAKALREHPGVNCSVDGDKILFKKDINIGIAVALPSDNLIVPVIRNADRLNLVGLSATINDFAVRARTNKLKPMELEGGTYSLSNVGTFGNVMGTPIIMQPQVAILAVGAIRKKPAVIETPDGDFIGVRNLMFLSHSYDHRIVDGALGGRFVRRVADLLESFDPNREI